MKQIYVACAALALATTAASAADLPSRRAPPVYIPPPVAAYSWTGFEFGLTTTVSFPEQHATIFGPGGGALAVGMNKVTSDYVGGGAAYNYQFTPGSGVVIGAQADASFLDTNKNTIIGGGAAALLFHQRISYFGTVNGRIGYAFDRFLVYGTGGFAYAGLHEATGFFIGGFPFIAGIRNGTDTGYDFGGGVEYAIPQDSILNYLSIDKLFGIDKTLGLDVLEGTVRAEFIHYNLGTQTVPMNLGFSSAYKTEGNMVRFGLGYKFSPTPAAVVAKY